MVLSSLAAQCSLTCKSNAICTLTLTSLPGAKGRQTKKTTKCEKPRKGEKVEKRGTVEILKALQGVNTQ